jgi:hypothetical protein
LDREKVLEFIKKHRPSNPVKDGPGGYTSGMSFANLSHILKYGWTARNVKDNNYKFFSSDELQEYEYIGSLGEFFNETNRAWVDYVGDCIFHAKNPSFGGEFNELLPSASGTPLEFFARLIVGGFSKEKFIELIPQYLNAMEKSKSFGTIMSAILKKGS